MDVLIVDDEADNRRALRRLVADLGHNSLEARDGAEAWDMMLATRSPRIVISDWMMPREDGLEFCRRVRAHPEWPYVYIILLSGQRMSPRSHEQAMAEGVDDFMIKPFDPVTLAQRLRVAERIVSLTERVNALEDIVPMCAYCRRVRDERRVYHELEEYVANATPAQFARVVCPDCAAKR